MRYGIDEMIFAPAALAGIGLSQAAAAPAGLLTLVAQLLGMLLADAGKQLILPVPPGEPLKPRLTHVCLASRLLPIPRAAWR